MKTKTTKKEPKHKFEAPVFELLEAINKRLDQLDLKLTSAPNLEDLNEVPRVRPLKWTEICTFRIDWCVNYDPIALKDLIHSEVVQIAGDMERYYVVYNGTSIGWVPDHCHSAIQHNLARGAKFYAFMRSDRRITIKVGYPQ